MQTEVNCVEKELIDNLFKVNLQLSMGLAEASKYLSIDASVAVAKAMEEATK